MGPASVSAAGGWPISPANSLGSPLTKPHTESTGGSLLPSLTLGGGWLAPGFNGSEIPAPAVSELTERTSAIVTSRTRADRQAIARERLDNVEGISVAVTDDIGQRWAGHSRRCGTDWRG